jgi:hypothetical protein
LQWNPKAKMMLAAKVFRRLVHNSFGCGGGSSDNDKDLFK